MRVLVTGGAGFVGRATVRALVGAEHGALDRRFAGALVPRAA